MQNFLFSAILIFSIFNCGQVSAQYDFWGDLEQGDFKAAYRRMVAIDTSRSNPHSAAPEGRPLVMNLWYPSWGNSVQEPMKHSEYLNFSDSVLDDALALRFYDYNLEMIREYSFDEFQQTWKWRKNKSTKKILNTQTHAFKDEDFPSGKYPLLIFHQGLGASIEDNAAMIEWLASCGYVIANASYQSEHKDYLNVDWNLEKSVKDIDFIVSHLSALPFIDTDRIGIMGQSYGGQAALAYAVLGQHKVSGVVTFDSTIDYTPLYNSSGFEKLFDPLLSKIERFNVPLLAFADEDAIYAITDSLIHSERIYVKVRGMGHGDFISQGAVGALLESEYVRKKYRPQYRQRWKNYLHICRHTLDFWNHVFHNTEQGFEPKWTSILDDGGEVQFEYAYRATGMNPWAEQYRPLHGESTPVLEGKFSSGKRNYTFVHERDKIEIVFSDGDRSEVFFFKDTSNDEVLIYISNYSLRGICTISDQSIVREIVFNNWFGSKKIMVLVD